MKCPVCHLGSLKPHVNPLITIFDDGSQLNLSVYCDNCEEVFTLNAEPIKLNWFAKIPRSEKVNAPPNTKK